MDISNNGCKINNTKPEIEQVQKNKQEYKIVGYYYIPRGMTLFSFNKKTRCVSVVEVKFGNTAHVVFKDGRLTWEDKDAKKMLFNHELYYFTALNMDNANRRVERFLDGKIKELFNLKEARNSTIKFY